MVVFTCNHCGDSLQKPKVAKHYETTCKRNPINLTCVDCFTDFKLQEYVVHTKCMTEEHRYSAKGTASKILKGEVKQTEWVNTVKTIIEQQVNAKPGIKNILQALVDCDNIPRKKVKFLNFMKNAFGFKFNNRDIEQVWDLLEAHKNTVNKSKEQKVENGTDGIKHEQEKTETLDESNQEKKSKKKKKKSEETVENGTNDDKNELKVEEEKTENLDESNKEKKSKKKKKKSEITVENGTIDGNEELKQEQDKTDNLDGSNQEKKSKKKKKKSEATVENGTINDDEEIKQELEKNLNVSNQENKSKKKKNKSESEETVENATNGVETYEEKTKKKRKSKQHDEETINGAEETPQKKQKLNETCEENEADTSSQKKKKRKSSQGEETPQKKQKSSETTNGVDNSSKNECEETNDLKLNDSQNESFSFKQVILDILTKKSKGLSKEALQNKVFKKYEAIMGPIENKEILLKKYNKKLKAVKEITCDNDKYKLSCSSD